MPQISLETQALYNPLASHFSVGQWVVINELGFMPYALCEMVITRLSFSTVVVDLHFTKAKQKCVEHNVHIPYEHLKK